MSPWRRRLQQSDQFEWVTHFLRQRGLLRSARLVMATVAASASLVPLSLLVGLRQRSGATLLIIGIISVLFTAGMTSYWLTRWPSRRLSEAAAIAGTLMAATWSLIQPTPAVAVLACTATAITGGYIAFFHSTRVLLFNFAVAFGISVVAARRLASNVDLATGAAAFWLIWFLNLSVPVAAYGASRALRVYTMRSDADPLTGLLNRRAFIEVVTRLPPADDSDATHVSIAMIDLDDFKRINDTHGHAAGDRVLCDVAALLDRHEPSPVAVCRAGGEEFLVAMLGGPTEAHATMGRLCEAISALPHHVTASIGTTSIERDAIGAAPSATSIEEFIAVADAAMYAAKRDGGNRVRQL